MSDFRYHVASLAAVFLALVLGILVGVAISDPGLADKVSKQQLRDEVSRLERRLEAASSRAEQSRAADQFVEAAYDAVVHERLAGRRVALVFVGGVDSEVEQAVRTAISDAGGQPILRMRALDVPIDPQAVAGALDGVAELTGVDPADLGEVGRRLGRELVEGGETPLNDVLTSALVEQRFGDLQLPADGVVVVRTAKPQHAESARFVRGLYAGLQGRVPAVGVFAPVDGEPPLPVLETTVDHVETAVGRVALVVLLAGGRPGHYGLGGHAEGILPPIEPLPALVPPGA